MSGQNKDSVQETTQDVFLYRSRDPHTAIPDWLAFCRTISSEARSLAHAIIVMSQGPLPPTKPEIAERLGVDVRTVYRRLNELNAAGVMHTRIVGRRNLYIFIQPSSSDRMDQMTHGSDDACATDRMDQMTHASSDPCASHDPLNRDQLLAQQEASNGQFPEESISDPTVGVDVGHDSLTESRPTSTNRAPLKTPLARWMQQFGINAAPQFQDPGLDYWTYRRFCEDRRAAGWPYPQIVVTLQRAPLDYDPLAQPRAAGDQADEYLDQLADDQADDAGDELARHEFSARVRRELIDSANRRPQSYHGGKR